LLYVVNHVGLLVITLIPTSWLVAAVELREQLHARERELESKEGAIAAWEDGLVAFEHAIGRMCSERDDSHVWAEAAYLDYLA
jgi:hypothetical protein